MAQMQESLCCEVAQQCGAMMKNLMPAKKSEVKGCLGSTLQGTLHFCEGKDWVGHGNFPSSIKPNCHSSFSTEQPCKAGAVYTGKNQNGVQCGWLIAFSAIGGSKELKVYVECGKKEKYDSVDWRAILDKLNDADADSDYVDSTTGCVAKAVINNCPSIGGARIAACFGDTA